MKVKDITLELDQLQRGWYRQNCMVGYYCGGVWDGKSYVRRWDSQTMTDKDKTVLYVRTGEIFEDVEQSRPMIVYRPGEKVEGGYRVTDHSGLPRHHLRGGGSITADHMGQCM